MENLLIKYWPLLAAGVAGIIWLIRLEGKVKQVERTQTTDGERMAKSIEKLSNSWDKMADAVGEMKTTLAGIVGYEKGASEARRSKR